MIKMKDKIYGTFLIASALALVFLKVYSKEIEKLNIKDNFYLLSGLLLGIGMIFCGIKDLKKESKYNKKRVKFSLISDKPLNPIKTLSIGQIISGIMAIIFVIIWISIYSNK